MTTPIASSLSSTNKPLLLATVCCGLSSAWFLCQQQPEQPRIRTALRHRLSLAEHGQGLKLTILGFDQLPAQHTPRHTQDQERAHTLATATRKVTGGCLRTASQLLIGLRKVGPPTETVLKVWDLSYIEPVTDPSVAETYPAAEAARRAPWTNIRKRTVNTWAAPTKAGAEPGSSAWRSTFAMYLHEASGPDPLKQ